MSDSPGQPPDHLHLLSLPHLFFEAFTLGDVAENALYYLLPFELCQAGVDLDCNRMSVGMGQVQLFAGDSCALEGPIQNSVIFYAVTFKDNLLTANAHYRSQWPPDEFAALLVGFHDNLCFHVQHQNRILGSVDEM